jgi:MFS family permease
MMRYNPDLQSPISQTMPGHLESSGRGQSGRSGRATNHPPSSSLPFSQPAIDHVFRTELDSETEQSRQRQQQPPEPFFSVTSERSNPDESDGTDVPPAVAKPGSHPGLRHSNPISEIMGDRSVPESDHGNGQNGRSNGSGDGSKGKTPSSTDSPEAERGLLPVLQNLNFLKLWSGQVFSQLADKVYLVLMIALIASRFQSEGQTISGWVSSLMIAFTIPAVLFGSVAGVFVDHWRKRAVMVATNLLRGALVLSLPLLLWSVHGIGPLAGMPAGFLVLLVVTFLVSTLTQFFAPAEQAAIPLLVERKHLLSANSLYTMTMMASVIVGFALGEPLLELAGHFLDPIASQVLPDPDFGKELLVGGSYAIAGLILMLLNTNEKVASDSDESLPDVWANIRDGLRYLKHQSHVRFAMIQLVILFSIFAALAVLAVRLAEVMPEIKSSQFGFLLAAGGVGMAIGAMGVGQFGQRLSRAQLSLYGSIGMAASLVAVSFFTQHLFPTLPLLVILGACAAIVGVPMQTAIQEETPEEMRGKVFGLQNNAINIALSLPLALAGVAEAFFGLQTVFIGLAVLALLGGILAWSISRTQFNQNAS